MGYQTEVSIWVYRNSQEHECIAELGNRLGEVEKLIDWEEFRPIIRELYSNYTSKGKRPNLDEILMIKMLVLQQWHDLSDPELERQANDRISSDSFLILQIKYQIVLQSGHFVKEFQNRGRTV